MASYKNSEFWCAVQGARNTEAEIVRGCTARLQRLLIVILRNAVMPPKNEFSWLPNAD